jgi:hypothetical protein
MAPRRRRTTRSAKKSPEPSSEHSVGTPAQPEEKNDLQESHTQDETCPACNADESPLNAAEKESWVRCDACKTWYHWVCAGNGDDLEVVDKW